MESVRTATEDDIPFLVDMVRAMLSEQRGARGNEMFAAFEARREPLAESFLADLGDPNKAVFVGEFHGTPLAFGGAEIHLLATGQPHCQLYELYVHPEARGALLGEAILRAAMRWAHEKGAETIDAVALPGDRDTKNFYESAGYSARLLIMHHRIEPGDIDDNQIPPG